MTARSPEWDRLEALVARAHGRALRLEPDELLELGDRYRAAAADLALARREFPHRDVTARLEATVRAAHGLVYSRASRREGPREYLATTLWRELRALRPMLLLSIGILVAGVAFGVGWALLDPLAASSLVPGGAHIDVHTRGAFYGVSVTARGGLATIVFVHNIEVAFGVVALGVTFGIGSTFLLGLNGAILGVLGVFEWEGGGFGQFVRLVVPHGLLELSCFTVAGAAGLAIARALVDPGPLPRPEAIGALAPALGAALVGIVTFLVVAGCVEGIITPYDLPLAAALPLGVGLCAAFWSAVVLRGRARGGVAPPQARARLLIPA